MRVYACLLLFLLGCTEDEALKSQANSVPFAEAIVGGELVTEGDVIARSTVFVMVGPANCSGVIVSKNMILTAAHCFLFGGDKEVFFGVSPDRSSEFRRGASHKINASADIALIKIDGEIPRGFKPAAVLTNQKVLTRSKTVILAGYGENDHRQLDLRLRKVTGRISDHNFNRGREILVDQRDGKGTCKGDSGGPAFVVDKGQLKLIGSTMRGHGEGGLQCVGYSRYAKVTAYRSWLKKTVRELGGKRIIGL